MNAELSIGPDLTAALNDAIERLDAAEQLRRVAKLINAAFRSPASRDRYVRACSAYETARARFDVLVGTYKPTYVNTRTFWVRGGDA